MEARNLLQRVRDRGIFGKLSLARLKSPVVHRSVPLDPETLLSAYAQGAFPMADREGGVRWYTADPRGIFPLDRFHVPHNLRQLVKQNKFEIKSHY